MKPGGVTFRGGLIAALGGGHNVFLNCFPIPMDTMTG
jgi:hypothetical protein